MKIAMTGTHSTGKTTLVEALRTEPQFKDYFFDVNVTRWVNSLGFPINTSTSDASQEVNMIARVAHLNSFDNIIADRSITDVLAYTAAGEEISERSLQKIKKLWLANIHKYDYIFYLKPEFDSVDDGTRAPSEDVHYRNEIDFLIGDFFSYAKEHYGVKIHPISGSVRQRVEQVLKITGI